MSLPHPLPYHKTKITLQMAFSLTEPVNYGVAHLLLEKKYAKE